MSTITITPLQSLALDNVLGSKRWKDENQAEIFAGLSERILLSKEVRESCFRKNNRCPMCARPETTELNEEALDKLVDRSIEIDKTEAKTLLSRLKEWREENGIGAADVKWFVPLRKALEAVS